MGVHSVAIALAELGWFFREQPTSDFGIDAHAEAPDRYASLKLLQGYSGFATSHEIVTEIQKRG